ncbi:GNAT family protein [Methanospirillum lacunae]|uniref:N-acetyltransferase domain-containing protein n=1 Tax=Methanospirillum lacunae TaxID=668570 RepID=A0A2V2N996_9EURY|nr:hypothetical protein [Methanospirillum lacunae]PWR74226.1 hypothetical protein DK846_03490 [Methanospirillum lacunae]
MRISIHFNSRKEQNSLYDWADISVGESRIGKARCKIDKSTITIFTINIYQDWERRGYGKEFIDYCKEHYLTVIADRVRPVSIGFWESMEFTDTMDGCWIFHAPLRMDKGE